MQALAFTARPWHLRKTVFCCERHASCATPVNVLFFSLLHVNSYNPEASGNHSPFSRMGRKKLLVQDTLCAPGTITTIDPRNTGRTCDRPFLGTHRCLELAYPLALGEQPFPGVNVAVLFAPSHPAPLAQSSGSNADTSPSSTLRARRWYSTLLPVPPRADITCGLPRMPLEPRGRTRREKEKMQQPARTGARTACDALHSIAFCRRQGTRTGHLLPFVRTPIPVVLVVA